MLLFTATFVFNKLTILQGNYVENISVPIWLYHVNRIETQKDNVCLSFCWSWSGSWKRGTNRISEHWLWGKVATSVTTLSAEAFPDELWGLLSDLLSFELSHKCVVSPFKHSPFTCIQAIASIEHRITKWIFRFVCLNLISHDMNYSGFTTYYREKLAKAPCILNNFSISAQRHYMYLSVNVWIYSSSPSTRPFPWDVAENFHETLFLISRW